MSDRETAHEHLAAAIKYIEQAEERLDLDSVPYPRNAYWKQFTHQAEEELKKARKVMSA